MKILFPRFFRKPELNHALSSFLIIVILIIVADSSALGQADKCSKPEAAFHFTESKNGHCAEIYLYGPMLPIIGVKILKIATQQFNTKWPDLISIGYTFGDENYGLPGTLKYGDKLSQAGYKVGLAACKVMKI